MDNGPRKLRARNMALYMGPGVVPPVVQPSEKPHANKKLEKNGLKDVSNVAGYGYINKVRRSSTSTKDRDHTTVSRAKCISFKPEKGRIPSERDVEQFLPSRHVPPKSVKYSPMDTEPPLMKIPYYKRRVPRGVTDIDAISDPLNCSIYAQDIIDYLQDVERRWSFPKNYLNTAKVTPKMRSVLMDWLIQIQVHLDLSQSTLHLCVGMIDRVLYKVDVCLDIVQLIAISCILLAAKINERYLPEIEELCYLTQDTYTRKQVLHMEKEILRAMKFDFNIPNPVTFLDRFLMVKPYADNQQIQGMSMFLLDLSLTDLKFVHFPPSLLAASALYLSRDLLGCSELWDSDFSFYTKYSEEDLQMCYTALWKLLPRMKNSKLKGAHTKYASKDFQGISKHVCLAKFLQENGAVEKIHETCV